MIFVQRGISERYEIKYACAKIVSDRIVCRLHCHDSPLVYADSAILCYIESHWAIENHIVCGGLCRVYAPTFFLKIAVCLLQDGFTWRYDHLILTCVHVCVFVWNRLQDMISKQQADDILDGVGGMTNLNIEIVWTDMTYR